MKDDYIIEMLNITKEFPGIKANDNVTLRLKRGEIHALLGENGAGKSTLMSVLFGLYEPEKGEIRKNGKRVKIKTPNDATSLGIGMVHQHFRLVEVFTVLDNIILGAETTFFGFIKRKKSKEKLESIMKKYGISLDLYKKVEDITVGMQQKAEILKMLYRDNEILIFDEPTAVLTHNETKELMKTMKSFRNEGKTILFITHKLDEIMEVSDRVTVMRKGQYVGTVETKDVNKNILSEMMVGRPVEMTLRKKKVNTGNSVLSVKNLTVASEKKSNKPKVDNVSFDVKEGEIVCIAGIDGNGQSELTGAITGFIKPKEGTIELLGEDITDSAIRYRNELGISHIPEDRHKHGLVLDFPLQYNCVLLSYFKNEFQHYGFIDKESIRSYADDLIERYDVRSGEGASTITRTMSGGNQQKAIIGREIDRNKALIVAVQPTRGLDVGAIEGIHRTLIEERDKGKAILLFSLELSEVMNLSDRILVIHEGKIKGEFTPESTNVAELGLYMSGAKEGKFLDK